MLHVAIICEFENALCRIPAIAKNGASNFLRRQYELFAERRGHIPALSLHCRDVCTYDGAIDSASVVAVVDAIFLGILLYWVKIDARD
jgi:hypothetical protein